MPRFWFLSSRTWKNKFLEVIYIWCFVKAEQGNEHSFSFLWWKQNLETDWLDFFRVASDWYLLNLPFEVQKTQDSWDQYLFNIILPSVKNLVLPLLVPWFLLARSVQATLEIFSTQWFMGKTKEQSSPSMVITEDRITVFFYI
jgi:hypothetical protein